MSKLEFIFDTACPNIEGARKNLVAAQNEANLSLEVQEWNRDDPNAPTYVKNYGSPTILVNGEDIAGNDSSSDANCCRVYRDENDKMTGIPSIQLIKEALIRSTIGKNSKGSWKRGVTIFPVIGAVMIPGISCPACLPAYAGLLSSVGIGFFNYTPYLLPLTLIFLAVALVALGYRAKTRHGYYPLMLGAAGSVLLVFGKFLLSNNYLLYSGIGIMVGASIWNSLPSRAACPACSDTKFHQINNNK